MDHYLGTYVSRVNIRFASLVLDCLRAIILKKVFGAMSRTKPTKARKPTKTTKESFGGASHVVIQNFVPADEKPSICSMISSSILMMFSTPSSESETSSSSLEKSACTRRAGPLPLDF